MLVPDAQANLAPIPEGFTDEQVLMGPDIEAGRIDLGPMVTHRFKLDDIVAACELFANQRDGVLKVAIKPG